MCCLHVLLLHFLTTAQRPAESATDIRVEDEVPSQRCLQPLAGLSSTNWCLLGASWCEVLPALAPPGPHPVVSFSASARLPMELYQRKGLLHVRAPQSVYIVHFCTPMIRVSVLVCLSYPVIRPCCYDGTTGYVHIVVWYCVSAARIATP